MGYLEWKDRLEFPTDVETDLACLLLESLGYKMGVDFGYANARGKVERLSWLRLESGEDYQFLRDCGIRRE